MASKPKLDVNFTDFWNSFSVDDNFFLNILREDYEISVTNDPDILFCSVFGNSHQTYSCTKVWFSGENRRPNFERYDLCLAFDIIDHPRFFRLPLYFLFGQPAAVQTGKLSFDEFWETRTKFCNMVVSSPYCSERIAFFEYLSGYKNIDSAGTVFNNIGGPLPRIRGKGNRAKLDFQAQYRFSLAFENTSHPGYTTEKLFQAMLANSLPIYWGNPLVGRDFNENSFINVHSFPDWNAVRDWIEIIDTNPDFCRRVWNEPWLEETSYAAQDIQNMLRHRFHEIYRQTKARAIKRN